MTTAVKQKLQSRIREDMDTGEVCWDERKTV